MTLLFSFSKGLSTVFYILVALFSLLLMVLIHELGHYTAGKLLKFKIEEFSVGFGPKLLQKTKKNGEKISLRAIPLGGYCAFYGEDQKEENSECFNAQKPWKRLIVLVSGVLFNFISAIIFFFILLVAFGYQLVGVKTVEPTSMNYGILQQGDVVYGINDTKFDFFYDDYFSTLLSSYVGSVEFKDSQVETHGETYGYVPLNIKRNGEKMVVNARIKYLEEENCWSFINDTDSKEFAFKSYRYKFFEAIPESFSCAFKWSGKIFVILGDLITGKLGVSSLTGPVGTIQTIAETTQKNFSYLFLLVPVIAVNLAIFNILPIPSLDGARCVFVLIEMIRKKPVNRDLEAKIHGVGLMVLLGFVVIVDILHYVL